MRVSRSRSERMVLVVLGGRHADEAPSRINRKVTVV